MSEQKLLITCVKLNKDDTAHIDFMKSNDIGAGVTSWDGQDKVTQEFKNAFLNCKEGFLGCMPELKKDKVTMNILKFGYNKGSNKLENALYSVKYAFNKANNAVINISTPQLPIYKDSFDEKTFCIAGKHETDLYNVIELAEKYLEGEARTHQQSLPLGKSTTVTEPEAKKEAEPEPQTKPNPEETKTEEKKKNKKEEVKGK